MEPARRLCYLQALGIEVYRLRSRASANSTEEQPVESVCLEPQQGDFSQPLPKTDNWDRLQQYVKSCQKCSLAASRTQTVFGTGNPTASWMVIGEAPGADEDRQGEPFVGRAGQLLDEILWAAGHPRETVYIANILKCRPPKNRDPRPEEVTACRPYLLEQIKLVQPELILCVGRIAAQQLLQVDTPIGKLRGSVHAFEAIPGQSIPVIVTYHPAYLLRSPGEKRKVWQDIKLARQQH
ncbi:MAG: uracil-DNA glycosylase [Gammaproteobacteria bacterium]|nr:MAG: uracil-DNA glycosylase [Gammaproteobacteria bacterium]